MINVTRSNPIRIYEQTLNLVCELDDYSNAYFTTTWHGFGKFSIQSNANTLYAPELTRGRIVMFGKDTRRVGIITEVNKEQGKTGKGSQVITASGYELKFIFSWRQVLPQAGQEYYSVSNSAETVMKTLVKDQCGSTADADRQFPLFEIDTDNDTGASYLLKARYSPTVADELNKCSVATGVGFWVYIDESNKKYRFQIGLGTDRTSGQSTNPRAIFSDKFNTIRTASYGETDDQYRNYAFVAGQGLGVNRTVREVYTGSSEPTGFNRREMFVDARDLSSTTDIDSRGGQKLQEQNIQVMVDGSPLNTNQLVYGTDYTIGDIVTVDVYNAPYDARITEVKESWDSRGYAIDLVFGRETQTISTQFSRSSESLRAALSSTEGYIIESGSNANGNYIKFSEGTMICYRYDVSVGYSSLQSNLFGSTSGNTAYGQSATLSFPVAFYSAPAANSEAATGSAMTTRCVVLSATQFLLTWSDVSTATTAHGVSWVAIGRWRA